MNFKEWLAKEENGTNRSYKLVSTERLGDQQSGNQLWRNWQRIRPGMDIANIVAGTIGGGIFDKEMGDAPRSDIFQPKSIEYRNKDFFLIEDQEVIRDPKEANQVIAQLKNQMKNFVLAQYMGKFNGGVPAFWRPNQYPIIKREDAQWLLVNHSRQWSNVFTDPNTGMTTVVVIGQFRYPVEVTDKIKGDLYRPTQTGIQGQMKTISPLDTNRFGNTTS